MTNTSGALPGCAASEYRNLEVNQKISGTGRPG